MQVSAAPTEPQRSESNTPIARQAVYVCGLDSRKLTFGEWWRSSPGISALIGWCSKIFGARILDEARILAVVDCAALEMPMAQLGDAVRAKVMPQVDALRALGFGEPHAMPLLDVFTNRETLLIAQVHN